MNARTFLKTIAAPALIAIALVGCDSNPVAPMDPSERVQLQEAQVQYQSVTDIELELGTGIMATARDTIYGTSGG